MKRDMGHSVWGMRTTGGLIGAVVIAVLGCGEASVDAADDRDVTTTEAALAQNSHDHGKGCLRLPADTPAGLVVPDNECLKVQARGVGVQIYTCVGGAYAPKAAPEANLLDRRGGFLGNHFLGPTWQWHDGSKIKGAVAATDPGPHPAQDIAWLLLSVPSEEGDGELADVKHIQRLHTVGGVRPAGACADGTEVRVPYTADYLFFHRRPGR